MNKNLVSFLVFVVGLAVFHNAIFPIFTPKPIGWISVQSRAFFVQSAVRRSENAKNDVREPQARKSLLFLGYLMDFQVIFDEIS